MGGGRPPLPPAQRISGYSVGGAVGYGTGPNGASGGLGAGATASGGATGAGSGWGVTGIDEGSYEPLFLASSEGAGPPPGPAPPVPQAPQTGLLRRRSEHRRSGRREHGRRAASVGPSISPRQQQVTHSL